MKNLTNNSTLFITSAMLVTMATLSLLLLVSAALLRKIEISLDWLFAFGPEFGDMEMALLSGALFLAMVSIVRCFSNDKPLAAFASLMFVVGFLYLVGLGLFGIIVFAVLQTVPGVEMPSWSILPVGFAFFLMLRLVLNVRRRSRRALAVPVVTVTRLNADG